MHGEEFEERIKELFTQMDTDGSAALSEEELAVALEVRPLIHGSVPPCLVVCSWVCVCVQACA